MEIQGIRKLMAILLLVSVVVSFSAISAYAQTEYTPNRSITITNVSEANPTLRFSVLPSDLEENGPYHMFAKMKIENYELINSSNEGAVTINMKYGNYDDNGVLKASDKQTNIKWTANTNGWADMTLPDGHHIALDDFDTDLIIEFSMTNVKGSFTFADFIIADKDNQIVYSLANDVGLSGVTNLGGSVSGYCYWVSSINKAITAITVESKGYDYTPNNVLSIDIPHTFPTEGESTALNNPESNAYAILDLGNAIFPAENGPYTLRGMFKVENFNITTFADHQWIADNACFIIEDAGIRPLRGNTDGWIPLVKLDGTPYSFNPQSMSLKWVTFMGSWGTTGVMSIADLEVLDKDGNVAYSFAADTTLAEGNIAWRTTFCQDAIMCWAYFTGLGTYRYEASETPVEHTDEDYQLNTFDETYTPFVEPAPSDTESSKPDNKVPDTGSGLSVAAFMLIVVIPCILLPMISKKRKQH